MRFTTADLSDAFPGVANLVDPVLHDYGGAIRFWGPIETVRVLEDNALVAQILETEGRGRVLVIDGGGSLRTALVGGRLAALAHANSWSGLVVHGCVRDSAEIQRVPVGVRAINTSPVRSRKQGTGERGGSVSFAGVTFSPGQFLYADEDGILLSDRRLSL
jgi:regulator of ribonuclease activity A